MLYENIAERVKEKRISIARLEHDLGMGNGTIGRWKYSSPRATTLKRVADYLSTTMDELLADK